MSHLVKTKNRWTTAQLELLVEVWENFYQHLKTGRGHEEIYEMMVHELKRAGCHDATVKQVRCRIHNLSGKYRKEAAEVQRTGIPSQWTLFSKISNFFEYTAPVRYRNVGTPVYDMTKDLEMDFIREEQMERYLSNRKREAKYEYAREFELDENSMDIEDDELEPDDDSVDVDRPEQEECSDAALYDDENTVDEFPAIKARESGRSGEGQASIQEKPESEKCEPKESNPNGTDSETDSESDSYMDEDDDDEWSIAERSTTKSRTQVFHIKSSFRHAVIEKFFSQLYSNQLYADVKLITCHEGITSVMPAHRMVLANFSEFFSSLLGSLKPNTNGNPITVCLQPDISQPVLQLLLEFMYTGKTSVADELLDDFLRCGQILKIRGVWSEEQVEPTDERKQPASEARVRKASNDRTRGVWSEEKGDSTDERKESPSEVSVKKASNDDACSASSYDEERSSASSPLTVVAPPLKDSSTDTDVTSEPSRKRRKKLTKKAKRARQESDQESMNEEEVSSEIGFDLLRSDTETEDNKPDEDEKRTGCKDTAKNAEDNVDGNFDRNEQDDDENDSTLDEEKENDGFGTDYIETDTDTKYETYIVVNGDSVSNSSTTAAITPEPRPEQESAPEPEAITEKESLNHNERIEQNGKLNGYGPYDEESHESAPSHDEEGSEHETPAAVTTIQKIQAATKPPDIRHKPKMLPSTLRVQQSSLKPTTSRTPQSSKPVQQPNQQTYAVQSTSRHQFVAKVRSVYSCKVCGKCFNTSDSWVEHVVYEHKDEQPTENNSEGHITLLLCDLCSKYLSSKHDWVHHILKKHTERYPHFHEELSMSDE